MRKERTNNTHIDPYSFNSNANPNHNKIFINSVFFCREICFDKNNFHITIYDWFQKAYL